MAFVPCLYIRLSGSLDKKKGFVGGVATSTVAIA